MYKIFSRLRIVLSALILIFIAAPAPAHAADPIFTVENIEVDATAENAIAAREKAFAEAQTKAFLELAARMLPENELATNPTPDPLTISTLIQDFEITNEKLSAVRYVGTYTFRFKDTAIRRHFGGAGTNYSDISSNAFLVLPFQQTAQGTILWSPFNTWKKAWNRAQNLRGLVPLEIPLGDLEDVRDLPDNSALSYNPNNLNAILNRYGASEAVIAIAIPDAALTAITNDNQTAAGRLTVEIYRTDLGRPELTQQINVIANGTQTRSQLYDEAAIRTHRALQKDWKAKTIVKAQTAAHLNVVIPITSLQHWARIQSDLKRAGGINGTTLKSLSPAQATVELAFQGDIERLFLTLAQSGYTLEQSQTPQGLPINILRDNRAPKPAPQNGQSWRL